MISTILLSLTVFVPLWGPTDVTSPTRGERGLGVFVPLLGVAEVPTPPSALERKIIARALKCVRMRKPADPLFLLQLLRIEAQYGVPPELRGMVLAAACSESGFNPRAEGDRHLDKRRAPKAIGLLQQWPWFERAYRFDRRDPIAATHAWLQHIRNHLEPTRRRCGRHLRGERLWVKAWVHAVRAPKPGGRCDQTPKHYIRLQRWRRDWR
ncbi:hypothetical protein KKF91_18860 [Myxococcota bacterium]|nr:hypothetical protein [Myxococcota bacterium]MBU1432605.1 hypothetical protein [Myxococcota bacterium]MBU1900052.1 hypothetical protein [Myxococcota bacterium]